MKKTKITRKIAAFLAAVMTMTTVATVTASASDGNTEIKSDEFYCILDLPKPPTVFEQIQKWIEQVLPKKAEPDETTFAGGYG